MILHALCPQFLKISSWIETESIFDKDICVVQLFMQMKWSWWMWRIHFFLAAKQVLKSSDSQWICKLKRQNRGRNKICLGWKKNILLFKIAAKYTDHKRHTNLARYYDLHKRLNVENLESLWCLTAMHSRCESLSAHSINQRWRSTSETAAQRKLCYSPSH